MSRTLLFVCTGNTCRSPMAEALASRQFPRDAVISAGVRAVAGAPASAGALQVMAEQGLDLQKHRSRGLTEGQVAAADLILCMTAAHKQLAASQFPHHAERMHVLRELAGLHPRDIDDPYGGSVADYRHSATQIVEALERIATLK